ncbi:phosphonate metabolism transcriptional regulator PhnF [Pectobacteriaceae bacterium CE70]|uniref:Phosphonate metabolism transcriptional regulator PhnF n=1 Tax=Serratia sp. (strain ATCC 39006) TaxID=104623 RepID=A0A2I5TA22_SERS3|nr:MULTISPECIES: phosphonate metabolism transcriptional regulator PhnF [Enterobacterales]WJV63974.1 phosphonate metabolism transcriptional regulator PhnF [Pectobacteriaceae bacterium C52]WJV68386.1 phosphonate metabolism transcriptional regulator PhnF [Pectobacteriaceae bacterium CE70]WJY12318.1 phosphonate metabolism transcriptional regulator PhnF [Pectobacteriaceae bacterium C80]AUH01396.1 phosphonate metabolism transcriptional regulator PhnF [Serratia sp. ATCC 39006]AUH05717.1 phosphonate m
MIQLSRHPTTLYQAIAAQLEEELRKGYHSGDYLPSEQQLADRYSVNRHTLRRAVDELVNKGLVQRRRGIGILVLMRPYDYPLHAQARFSQNLMEQGSHPTSERLLAVLRPCNSDVASALGCQEGEPVIHLRTLRRVNAVPVSVIDHYLPELNWWPALQQFQSGSLHDFIARELHQPLTRRQTRISARPAQAKERQLLETVAQSPLLCIRTLNICTDSDRVAEYSVSLVRAEMIELTMEH